MSAPSGTRKPAARRSAQRASAVAGGAAAAPVHAASAATPAARKGAGHTPPARARHREVSSRGSAGTSEAVVFAALPDVKTRHMLSAFTCGVSPTNVAAVAAAGGIDAWFEHQLAPDDIPDQKADATCSWWPALDLTPLQRFNRYKAGIETGWEMMQSLASWIDDASPHHHPPGRRDDGRLLVQPAPRRIPGHQRLGLADRVPEADPPARAGPLRGPPGGRDPAPGDGHVPQQRRVHRR